ncbi:MAG: hypothetical protein ACRCYP_05265 [Alphaproteobacteria bacterium]
MLGVLKGAASAGMTKDDTNFVLSKLMDKKINRSNLSADELILKASQKFREMEDPQKRLEVAKKTFGEKRASKILADLMDYKEEGFISNAEASGVDFASEIPAKKEISNFMENLKKASSINASKMKNYADALSMGESLRAKDFSNIEWDLLSSGVAIEEGAKMGKKGAIKLLKGLVSGETAYDREMRRREEDRISREAKFENQKENTRKGKKVGGGRK